MASSDDDTPMSFVDLMAVEPLPLSEERDPAIPGSSQPTRFISIEEPWGPGRGIGATFGGHVYAQAAYAASRTVQKGAVLCNITGHFIQAGTYTLPFQYTVTPIRDGGVYSLRHVTVHQHLRGTPTPPTPSFTATMTFKTPEPQTGPSTYNQPPGHLRKTYASVLAGKKPTDHPFAPVADIPALMKHIAAEDPYSPGVEVRRVDMTPYNTTQDASGYRQLQFYRVIGPDKLPQNPASTPSSNPTILNDPNLAACVHAYASDRNSLFVITRALGHGDDITRMASLSHTVIFHSGHARDLSLYDPVTGKRRWFVQEAWMGGAGEGRGIHESRIWSWSEGGGGEQEEEVLLARTIQDGLIRIKVKAKVAGGSEDGLAGVADMLPGGYGFEKEKGKL